MFQRNKGNRDNLLSFLTLNIAFSIVLLALPTSVLLILIGSRTTYIQDGAVYADINLGTLLVFSSMAAILTPCIYRPVSILYATHLAKQWIAASATTSFKGTSYLPSTPQYLLSVGNLGAPSLASLYKSLKYYFRRRKGGSISPVFTQSAICLAGLLFMTVMIVIVDVWIHFSSTSVVAPRGLVQAPGHSQGGVQGQTGGGEFSRIFAQPANVSQAPWRLQQGLQAFLDVNPLNWVRKINSSTVLLPREFPSETDITGTTVGIDMTCELLNLGCSFNPSSPGSSILGWDCTSIQPGASGTLSLPVNTTILPSTSSIASNFTLISAMGIPSLFNSSTSITVAQVFRCNGTLQNITYSLTSNALSIINKQGMESSPLREVLDLDSVPGKRDLLLGIEGTVAQSTVFVKGMSVTGIAGVYADGLARMFMSFLAGETIPAASLEESPGSLARILSRIPLAPLLFLSIFTGLLLLALLFVSIRALFANLNPPTLNGNPISIRNLHRQLTSPMAVLAATLGDSPLAMKVLFRGSEEGRVQFDILRQSSETGAATKEGSIGSSYSEVLEGVGEDEVGDSRERGFTFEPDPSPIGSGRNFQVGTESSFLSSTPRVHYPRKGSTADSSTGGYYSNGSGRRYDDGRMVYESADSESIGGSGWERFKRRDRQGSGEMAEQGMDDLSDEENRVFLGMQQRQEARDSVEDLNKAPRSLTTRGMSFAAEEGPPRENRL